MPGRKLIGRICLGVLLAWGLVMIVPDFYSAVSDLGAVGFAADNDGVVFDVRDPFRTEADSPAWRAGLRVGDRLDLDVMNCRRLAAPGCADVVKVLGGMGGIQRVRVGQTLTLHLMPGTDGVARTVTMTAIEADEGWVTRLFVLASGAVGVLVVVGAAWLVYLRPGRMTWGLFLSAIWFNPGYSFVYYLFLQRHPALLLTQEFLGAVAQGAAYAGLLQFALRVPSDAIGPRWLRLERALPVLALAVAAWQLAAVSNLFGFHTEVLSRSDFLVGLAVDALAVVILFGRLNGLTPQNRQRMWWVIAGCLIGMPAYIFSNLIDSTSLLNRGLGLGELSPHVGQAFLLVQGILAWFVFEAVRRPRVVSVTIPLRRITVFGLVLSLPALLLHQSIEPAIEFLHEHMPLPGWGWLIVASAILFMLGRLHELAADLADHVFNVTFRREAYRLHEAIGAVLRADGVDGIERLLVEAPARSLRLASAALFRHEDSAFVRTVGGPGWSEAHTHVLDRSDPALHRLVAGAPLPLGPDVAARLGFPEGLPAPVLAVPVADAIGCFAVLLFGPHMTGADLNADEREMLHGLARAGAVAYAHAAAATLRQRVGLLQRRLTEAGGAEDAVPGRHGPVAMPLHRAAASEAAAVGS